MIVEWEKDDTVAIVTLNNGEKQAQSPVYQGQSSMPSRRLKKMSPSMPSSSPPVMRRAGPKGLDLPWIMDVIARKDFRTIKDFFYSLNAMFKKILLFPTARSSPRINGHAAGNGAILACCCDFRLMNADRGYFFFPGVDINISYPSGIQEIIKKAFPYYKLEEAILTGKRYDAKELEKHHVIIKACDNAAAVRRESIAFAKTFKKEAPYL
ncbi:MAG: enoyl-CoA hydratase/isomerase family protein [Desulfobacterales bacterium]|nr:enoyl-CoA hydratase/isomerase family protein [Desulfobacterales bacterium]